MRLLIIIVIFVTDSRIHRICRVLEGIDGMNVRLVGN